MEAAGRPGTRTAIDGSYTMRFFYVCMFVCVCANHKPSLVDPSAQDARRPFFGVFMIRGGDRLSATATLCWGGGGKRRVLSDDKLDGDGLFWEWEGGPRADERTECNQSWADPMLRGQ